ncbi:MAG: hypothetical protein K2X63_11025, partial [Burkholderiaceae bacterium]|nr:hypothetical protein [Burkholderiaceae bacterium]
MSEKIFPSKNSQTNPQARPESSKVSGLSDLHQLRDQLRQSTQTKAVPSVDTARPFAPKKKVVPVLDVPEIKAAASENTAPSVQQTRPAPHQPLPRQTAGNKPAGHQAAARKAQHKAQPQNTTPNQRPAQQSASTARQNTQLAGRPQRASSLNPSRKPNLNLNRRANAKTDGEPIADNALPFRNPIPPITYPEELP